MTKAKESKGLRSFLYLVLLFLAITAWNVADKSGFEATMERLGFERQSIERQVD